MPCTDGGPSNAEYGGELKTKLDSVTDMLCSLCKVIEDNDMLGRYLTSKQLAWWTKHKIADQKRIDRENEEKRIANLKKHAIAKLTKAERDALGL